MKRNLDRLDEDLLNGRTLTRDEALALYAAATEPDAAELLFGAAARAARVGAAALIDRRPLLEPFLHDAGLRATFIDKRDHP